MQSQITERRDGVQLRKYFAEEEFYLPSVVYEFSSDRGSDARVNVVETLPADLGPEHVGFHTRLGQKDWELTADRLECETTVEANGEHRTVYALRPELDYDAEEVITEPDGFEVEPAESVAVVGGSPGTFTRSAGSDGGEEEPPAADSLVGRLVAELQAGTVPEDNREALRAELVEASEPPGSVDARIQRLQADVSDLRAYSDAMAAFLDEQGSAEQVIDGFRSRLDAFEAELESVESTLAEHDARLSAFQDQLETIEAELDSVSSELSAVGTDIEELSAELAQFDEQLPVRVGDRLAEIESELDDVSQFTDALEQAIRH